MTYYKPEKIILFGSAASGTMGPDSDIDSSLRTAIQTNDPLDIIVYTPQEYITPSRDSSFVGEEIAKKGKTVYAVLKIQIAFINRFYIPTRYPDTFPGALPEELPVKDDAKCALKIARSIVEFAEKALTVKTE